MAAALLGQDQVDYDRIIKTTSFKLVLAEILKKLRRRDRSYIPTGVITAVLSKTMIATDQILDYSQIVTAIKHHIKSLPIESPLQAIRSSHANARPIMDGKIEFSFIVNPTTS